MSIVSSALNSSPVSSIDTDNGVAVALFPATTANDKNYLAGAIIHFSGAPTAGAKKITVRKGTNASGNGISVASAGSRDATDTKVQAAVFTFFIGANQPEARAAATAIALPAGTVPTDTFAGFILSAAHGGALTLTAAALNFTTGYVSEALAKAALDAVLPSTDAEVFRFTLKTKVGSPFVCGTDALFGGASGNVASATTFYNAAITLTFWFSIRHDFSLAGELALPLPSLIHSNEKEAISVEVEASGTGGVLGQVVAFGFQY